MSLQQNKQRALWTRVVAIGGMLAVSLWIATPVRAAVSWDSQLLTEMSEPAGSGTQWWFDPFNWGPQDPADEPPYFLPPSEDGISAEDTDISSGTSTLPGGEGVVYHPDPVNGDPHFANAGTLTYPAGFGPQTIQQLYISRQTTAAENRLTIKGDLTLTGTMQLGRSSNTAALVPMGRVVQQSGTVLVNGAAMDIAATDTSDNVMGENYGDGVYEYHSGILEVSQDSGSGLRLSPSSSTVGAAGIGRFVMHNPDSPGYVRAFDYVSAAGAGVFLRLADGETTGVGITEFHFENGGTRPIQVNRNLVINNGLTTSGGGAGAIRSSRLDLVLDAAPSVDGGGVPQNLGLFDVGFSQTGAISGTGDLGDFFSSLDGSTLYTQGAMVSAMYLGTTYNWTISYTGNITWANDDPDAGVAGTISGTGGVDVVLIGHSSIIVPSGVNGDFNEDGKVDAADYITWRKNSANNPLPNDAGQTTQLGRYNLWVTNYGMMAPGGGAASSAAIPEPSALVLALIALCALSIRRRKSL